MTAKKNQGAPAVCLVSGAEVRKARLAKGLSLEVLADLARTSGTYISIVERDLSFGGPRFGIDWTQRNPAIQRLLRLIADAAPRQRGLSRCKNCNGMGHRAASCPELKDMSVSRSTRSARAQVDRGFCADACGRSIKPGEYRCQLCREAQRLAARARRTKPWQK